MVTMDDATEERVDASRECGLERGRLKVFLGMAAGVGKTYRMLRRGGPRLRPDATS